jgi:hypothetical protein
VLVRRQRRSRGPGTTCEFLLGQARTDPNPLKQVSSIRHSFGVSDGITYLLGYVTQRQRAESALRITIDQAERRARCVPDRTANHGDPRSLAACRNAA